MEGRTIYTTGAFVEAVKCTIDGVTKIRWVVESFEDPCFEDGQEVVVNEEANTFDGLDVPQGEDED